MTPDSLNIVNGNATVFVSQNRAMNPTGYSTGKTLLTPAVKSGTGKIESPEILAQKSLSEINKSQTPINKPIESSQNSMKGMLYSDISHKSIVLPDENLSTDIFPHADILAVNNVVTSPAIVEQGGWYITIVPDKRMNGGFLELTEKRDERKENLKEFYNPIVKHNKGKLLDVVG